MILRLIILMTISQTIYAETSSKISENLLRETNSKIENINTKTLQKLLKNPDMVLIDVRLPEEIDRLGGTIKAPQNVNIPRGWLEFRIADFVPNKHTPIVVYCGTNLRSPLATKTLLNMGYSNVKNYSGGAEVWQQSGLSQRKYDNTPNSLLFNLPEKITDDVWSAIGETAPATIGNSGHNNNLSFIVSDDGVLVFNAGGNYLLAQALHQEIKKITKQPVKYVVLENAQGHAILGANYWRSQGAKIIAHKNAATEIAEHGFKIFDRAKTMLGDKMANTEVIMPDEIFENKRQIILGKHTIDLLYLGSAHGPSDIVLHLPKKQLVITGDVAFHQRLLPILEETVSKTWLESWENLVALNPTIVIPGHGVATNMQQVTKYTKDYLLFMRHELTKIIDAGGSITDAYKIDQSRFHHLDTYEQLYRRNAARMFVEMEFE